MSHTSQAWQQVRDLPHPEGFTLGPINAETFLRDPKHMGFMLARYKFAAKMMRKCASILEVGAGEGVGSLILVRDTVAQVTATDFDPVQIRYAQEHVAPHCQGRMTFQVLDMVGAGQVEGRFEGLLCLDVIEHIHAEDEPAFLDHCAGVLPPGGVALFGTPNIVTDAFASPPSRAGHINLFDETRLATTLERHFSRVFLFSMNDEMVHTGYAKMAHYFLALCIK